MRKRRQATGRRRRRVAPKVPAWPTWFPDDPHKQGIAETLAHNFAINRALGVHTTPDNWPFNQYRRPAVVAFLARLAREYPADSAPTSIA